MNSPEGEIGGLIDGSHESCESRVSFQVFPALLDRASHVSMKKLPGWFGGSGSSRRRSKNDTLTCPRRVTRTYGWNWSAFDRSLLTRFALLHVVPPSNELSSSMSACMPSSSDAAYGARL